tara:strand:- start:521 stop:820 length:300 start_codon:yes stop_codon:yes gene_type:complete
LEKISFGEYYKHYLTLHQNKWNRRLHIVGQCATLLTLVSAILLKSWLLLLLTPIIVYPFAWTGHKVFEKNRPAAWSRPLWAKACDWVMLKDILIGKIEW